MRDEWKEFNEGKWTKEINVRDFINLNFKSFDGDEKFLEKPTERTLKILGIINDLIDKEAKSKGVLDIETEKISSLLSFDPGYIDKDNELIVGLQTDKPLKRAVNPFGGIRMSIKACEEYGYKLADHVIDQFKYRTTHNDGVFRVYTDEMLKARHTGIITGLPDAYGRGRIIGDYRRIALYGMDYLIEMKKKDKEKYGKKVMSAKNIQLLEDISKQIEFMEQLKTMANAYGDNIAIPAKNSREAVQWLYYGYLGAIKEQNGAANSIGRISTFLDIYFERDLKNNRIDEKGVQELIDDLVIKLRLVRHLRTAEYNDLFAGDPVWVTMSEAGMSIDGRHMVTKTSYRVLNTLYNLKSSAEPNITILWSEKLPENYKRFCAKVSIDTASIQYENDDIMRENYGDDYAIACCVSAMKIGKQMQYFGARCNIAKVLLMALNGGKDEIYGTQIGPVGKIFDEKKLDYDDVI
jgi:formate C-acetyltransferase